MPVAFFGSSADSLQLAARILRLKHPGLEISHIEAPRRGFDPKSRSMRMLTALVGQLMGFPRHLSQHVGGFVISRGPLSEPVPIENAAMPDRSVIEWDKDDLDALGLLKVDVLALGMLSAIRRGLEMISVYRGRRLGMADIPPECAMRVSPA